METSPAVVAGAEPFTADGGPLGVLLSHGFTGSPASMTPWGRALAERGHTVRVPRLPGHGTTWQDLNRTRWEDWYGEVEAAFDELRARCDTVAVAGLSMGGALALRLAEQRADEVDSVVLVNPAIGLRNWQLRLVPALKWVVPAMPGIGNDIKKPGADETGYDKTPLKALASQLKGWRLVAADLEKVTAPLLMFRSTDDHVVDETSLGLIRAGVSSEVAEYVTLHDSYHVATIDNDAELIVKQSTAFIESHARA
ncbi:alpha/beta hydrolase [Aeromicrobium terrae]|uniref:Alpha/beta fold hydrolase n=1 Tax=Aeromicrobium terrae TaxID=2498846 RepID=A0A5C8NNN2_9ACTN|nr:alpha/beta fold hydrolase [Aeromicrobium terrae]TXL62818.1 alpha/beta fold hydrolase [Aeromicrobium terrae]